MSILAFRKHRTAEPSWSYSIKGVIWHLVPCDSGIFVGEVRDLEAKQTSFFCLNRSSGEIFWEGITLDEPWWIGIEAVHQDRVFLHGFSTPDMPGHKGLVAIDAVTGRTAWKNSELRLVFCNEESVFASEDVWDGMVIHELDYRTGEALRTWHGHSEALKVAKLRQLERVNEVILFPTPLESFEESSDHWRDIIFKNCPVETVVGSIDILFQPDVLVFSYHQRENERNGSEHALTNIIKVVNLKNDELIFTTILNRHVQISVPDSFFVMGGMLYFIRDRSSLVALNINQTPGEK